MSFGMAYATKKRNKKCMAKGGDVKGVHRKSEMSQNPGVSEAGMDVRLAGPKGKVLGHGPKEEHKERLSELRSMPKPKLPMAEGGEIESAMHGEQSDEDMLDMVGRIIAKHMFSKGGQVANDVGVAEADMEPAEYDDLVLRDTMEDDSSAGNEHGDEEQDERDSDVVSKIMRSRKKKDRMPRPA